MSFIYELARSRKSAINDETGNGHLATGHETRNTIPG